MSNFSGNQINPDKLLLSKWTAVVPRNKEKHFLVSAVDKNEEGVVLSCTLEAVITGNAYEIDWKILKDNTCWSAGWLS